MDASASRRGPERLKEQSTDFMPPLTPRTIQESLRLKTLEEAEQLIVSTKDQKKLLERIQKENPEAYAKAYAKGTGRDPMKEMNDVYKTFESKESWLRRAGNFLWRNKGKIIIGAAAIGAGVAAWNYWPQIVEWAGGVGEAFRQWVRHWLGIPDMPKIPGLPGGTDLPGLPGGGAGGLELAPMPREIMPLPNALPNVDDAFKLLK